MIPGMGVHKYKSVGVRFADFIASALLTVWFFAHLILRHGMVTAQT